MEEKTQLAVQRIRDRIIRLEGRPPVMLARDLAEIYQVKPEQIAQAVRRNPDRFPEDFVFRLTVEEWGKCSLQFDGSAKVLAFAPHNAPLAFTREGANQLSSCLKSKVAADRSIQIMRAFSAIEERIQHASGGGDMILDSLKVMVQLRERQLEVEKTLAAQAQTLTHHDQALADQGKRIRAIAASQEEELQVTPEQEKMLCNLMERLISTRAATRKLPASEVAPSLWNWIKRSLGIRTFRSISRAQYPMALDKLQTQLVREEATLGQGTLRLVKKPESTKDKGPWADL